MKKKYYLIEIDAKTGQQFNLKRWIFGRRGTNPRHSMTYNSLKEAQRDMEMYIKEYDFWVYLADKPVIETE